MSNLAAKQCCSPSTAAFGLSQLVTIRYARPPVKLAGLYLFADVGKCQEEVLHAHAHGMLTSINAQQFGKSTPCT
jgi:hypothetical protein